jgi:Tfp pilus assembly protein PilV
VTLLETLIGILILVVIYLALRALDNHARRLSAADARTSTEQTNADLTPSSCGSDGEA